MLVYDATLQGRTIVLDLDVDGRATTLVLDRDEADELAQRLIELVIESDLDDIEDEGLDDDWIDEDDDDEEAA